jgi:hypothetical protein
MDYIVHKHITEWTETEKAFWILENGEPRFAWIFERNGQTVYKRPIADPSTKLPPWISPEREEVTNKIVGREVNMIILDDLK